LHGIAGNAVQRSVDWLAANMQPCNDDYRLPPPWVSFVNRAGCCLEAWFTEPQVSGHCVLFPLTSQGAYKAGPFPDTRLLEIIGGMTGCPSREQLRQLLAEQLAGPEATAVEGHVAACADCQRILDELTKLAPTCPPRPPLPEDSVFLQHLENEPPWQPTVPFIPADLPAPLPTLPGYEILAEVGRGGMGVVYKARQTMLNRLVAVKMIRQGELAQADALVRFRREGELLARVQHANVVQVHHVGVEQGQPFIVMEYVEGTSLQTWLRHNRPTPMDAAQMVETLATAMHAAHQCGIIHRDLKPANVLLAEGGTLKVTDFGLAKNLTAEGKVTSTGAVVGTPSYMAPEQAQGDSARLGVRTDVYALGAILYELLAGRAPFEGPTPLEVLLQVVHSDPGSLRRLQPAVPRDLETICLKCLAKEPAKRYPCADSLAKDLRRFRAGEPIQARPTPVWERGWKWGRRRPGLALAIVLTLFVLLPAIGIGAWAWRERQLPGQQTDADLRIEQLRKKLRNTSVTLDMGLAAGNRLGDVLEFLSDRYDVNFSVDTVAFQEEGARGDVRLIEGIPPMRAGFLDSLLQLILGRVRPRGGYIVRPGYIEVTTAKRALAHQQETGERAAP
jgi:tRNA A-37 threonylcarbamoyl transferase component Bud32